MKYIVFTFFFFSLFFVFDQKTIAQGNISLSITPPLLEVTIQPGKEVKQTYALTNNGSDIILKPKLIYFIPSDLMGNVITTDIPAPDWIRYNPDQFTIKNQEQKIFNISLSPPETAPETDHFITLIFESQEPNSITDDNLSLYKTEIGSNILVTISKDGNPKKSAEVVKFKAPLVSDPLIPFSFEVLIMNNGNSFWKPNGKIIINDEEMLKLAPQNILSGYSRSINCLDGESLVDCTPKQKLIIGKMITKLEFSIDDEAKIYKSETTTYVFPFIYAIIILLLLTLIRYKVIFKVWRRRN